MFYQHVQAEHTVTMARPKLSYIHSLLMASMSMLPSPLTPHSGFPQVFISILTFQRFLHSNSVFLLSNLLQLPPALISPHPTHNAVSTGAFTLWLTPPPSPNPLLASHWLSMSLHLSPKQAKPFHLNFSFQLYLQVLPPMNILL